MSNSNKLELKFLEPDPYRDGYASIEMKDWMEKYKGRNAYTKAMADDWKMDLYNNGNYLSSHKLKQYMVFPVAMKFILSAVMGAGIAKGRRQILKSLKHAKQ